MGFLRSKLINSMCNWIPLYYIFTGRDGCEKKKKNEAISKMKKIRSMDQPAG